MLKGMWTKHIGTDSKVFYFNAEQNNSVWEPPPDSIVHEAPVLVPIAINIPLIPPKTIFDANSNSEWKENNKLLVDPPSGETVVSRGAAVAGVGYANSVESESSISLPTTKNKRFKPNSDRDGDAQANTTEPVSES